MTDKSKASDAPSLADTLIEDGYHVRGDELQIGGVDLTELAKTYGTPFYVYDRGLLRRNYRRLAKAVDGFADIFYSVKANPRCAVAKTFVDAGAGLEIASKGELQVALNAGCNPDRIVFAGPGKGGDELEFAVSSNIGEIHLETFEEIKAVAKLGENAGQPVPVSIRVNPAAAAQGGAMRMGGKPTAFGFDEEILADVAQKVAANEYLKLQGLHMFAGTQILKADVLLNQWAYGLDLAGRLAGLLNRPLKTIDLGGGLGAPYHQGDAALDLDIIAAGVSDLRQKKADNPLLKDSDVILEPGRFLTANAGLYVMAVRAVKESRGERFIVADGGMHHHLAASGNLGQVIKRDYPIVAATRMNDRNCFQGHVVGPLCTPLDTLGRQTTLPDVAPGDLIAVMQSGAYGHTASPINFLSHPAPPEVIVDDGAHQRICVDKLCGSCTAAGH